MEPAEGTFLSLLVDGAPAAAFHDAATATELAHPDQVPAIRFRYAAALRLREMLEEQRRHERELAALSETARDLSSLRNVEQVLHDICVRARSLLGTNAAYIMLNDPTAGDTYMRTTDGIASVEFRRVRLPLGSGLGGLVAERNAPVVTTDYIRDPRIRHAGVVDRAVASEGLRAIVGVPLHRGTAVVGVLMTAYRGERAFERDDVVLLSSLGSHASVALESARLFDEHRDAIEHLRETTRRAEADAEVIGRGTALHERLLALVLEGADLEEVTSALVSVVGGEVLVADTDRRTLATAAADTADPATPLDPASPDVAELLARAARTSRSTLDAEPGGLLVSPMVARKETLGFLVLRRPGIGDTDRRLVERAGLVMALLVVHGRALLEAEHRLRGELLGDLLAAGGRDLDGLCRRATMLGIDVAAGQVVVVAGRDGPRVRAAAIEAGRLASERKGLAAEVDAALVMAFPHDDPRACAELVARRLNRVAPGTWTVGAAGPVPGLEALPGAHRDARRCQRTLLALGRAGSVATPRDLGVFSILFARAAPGEVDAFVTSALGPVIDHDGRRRTDLTATLEAYLDAGGSVTRTAERLHVHVNTLYQRLARLDELLGAGWRDPDRRLQLHLALRARQMAGALGDLDGSST